MVKNGKPDPRSHCPISYSLDLFGDKWSLLVVRDLLFNGKRYYGEFLKSEEKIATNILSDRLEKLEQAGIVEWKTDPDHGSKVIYRLTPKGLDLLPILLEIILWAAKYDPLTASPPEFLKKLRKDRKALMKEVLAAFV